MLIEGADYFVRVIPFPKNVKNNGMTLLNDDSTFSVYLDANCGHRAKKKAMRHELRHMTEDDMFGDKDIRTIEKV